MDSIQRSRRQRAKAILCHLLLEFEKTSHELTPLETPFPSKRKRKEQKRTHKKKEGAPRAPFFLNSVLGKIFFPPSKHYIEASYNAGSRGSPTRTSQKEDLNRCPTEFHKNKYELKQEQGIRRELWKKSKRMSVRGCIRLLTCLCFR